LKAHSPLMGQLRVWFSSLSRICLRFGDAVWVKETCVVLTDTITLKRWYSVSLVVNSSFKYVKIYLDAVEVLKVSLPALTVLGTLDSGQGLYIGPQISENTTMLVSRFEARRQSLSSLEVDHVAACSSYNSEPLVSLPLDTGDTGVEAVAPLRYIYPNDFTSLSLTFSKMNVGPIWTSLTSNNFERQEYPVQCTPTTKLSLERNKQSGRRSSTSVAVVFRGGAEETSDGFR
jgi:hypothetical protein